MNEIITAIAQKLRTIHQNIYFERAPQGKKFPYIVFRIENSNKRDRLIEDFVLSLNFWDNDTDTEVLDNIVDRANKALDYWLFGNGEWKAMLTKTSYQIIPDPNPSIRRREVLYRLRVYRLI